jgi:hypothetical protein
MEVFILASGGLETGCEQEKRLDAIPEMKVSNPIVFEVNGYMFIFCEKQAMEFWYERLILPNGWYGRCVEERISARG